MPSKKKMEFNNIIKEFGFPTSIKSIENTYKSDCLLEGSEFWRQAKEFEKEFAEELERQNSDAPNYSKTEKENSYYRFQDIFLRYQKIFDPELYLLQMSILMEKDNSTKETIKAILKTRGITNPSNEIVDALFVKDDKAISNLIQTLNATGMNIRDSIQIAQFFKSNNLQTPNVYLPASNKRELKSLMNTIKNRLANSDVAIVELANSTKEKEFTFKVTNSQIHIGNENFLAKKEKENQTKYEEAQKEFDIRSKIKKIRPFDLKHIIRYQNLGVLLSDFLYVNQSDNTPEELYRTVISNLRYIDFDKLLLTILQVEFDKYGEDVYKFSNKEAKQLQELSNKIEKLLYKKNIEMESDRFFGGISFPKLKAGIAKLNNSYIAGEYYTEGELLELVKDYLYGQKNPMELTPHEFKNVLGFTDNEILFMLKKNPDLLDYLIRNDIIGLDEKGQHGQNKLFEFIEKEDKISSKQLQILYDNNKLTPEYILQLYMQKGKVDIEAIRSLKQVVPDDFFEGMVNSSELVELYLDKDNDKEKFEKYSKLYKLIEIEEKTLEEKKDIGDDILAQNIELLKDESIMELYNLGLIAIDTLVDYTGGNLLKQLYLSNELKPIDAKRLFYDGIINEEMLKSIMLDPSIDEGRKITLLYSTFPEVEDTDIMRKLEGYLRDVTENPGRNSNTQSETKGKTKPKETEGTETELRKLKKAYEPRDKYRLISIIDPEYKFKYYSKDGSGVFYFPNREEYLIEKLYDKNRKPATNVATYILSKKQFEENKNKIIQR